MATQPGTLELLLGEIGPILARVEHRLAPDTLLLTCAELGLQFPDALLNDAALVTALTSASSSAAAIPELLQQLADALSADDAAPVIQATVTLVRKIADLLDAIDDVAARLPAAAASVGMSSADVVAFAQELPKRLVEQLAIEGLEGSPAVANVLQLLGVIDREIVPGIPGDATHPEFERKRLHLSNLIDLAQSPADYLVRLYGWGDPAFDAQRLFTVLEDVTARFGLPVALTPATATDPLTLRIALFELKPDASTSPPGLTFSLDAPIEADVSADVPLGSDAWTLTVTSKGEFDAGLTGSIRPAFDLSLLPPTGTLSGELLAAIVGQIPGGGRFPLLGVAGSSRLEVGQITASLGLRFTSNGARSDGEIVAEAQVKDGHVILDSSQGDSFISHVLGGASGDAAFDLGASWSPSTGLRLTGSSAIEIAIPVHVSVGPIELTTLVIRAALGNGAVPVEISGNFRGQLGPLQFVVQRLGLQVTVTAPDDGGNLGPLDLDAAFKPPSGIGLAVIGGGFTGGGFLGFEPEAGRYSGMLDLEFQDTFTIKAFGLLETRLPSGEKGFSLVLVISAEFTPIQLGFGFTLNGVGGLLGLNRTVNVDRLVTGLRDQTLSNILFPTNLIANADRILSDLRQVFPPARGRFVFGPMAKIGWSGLITADVGLMLEVPEPVRVIILGVVRGILPDEQTAILKLQVNFLGVIDFQQERFSFDASLFDSHLLAFTLTGDMALRLYWGGDANFLVTVGGFHPAYQPPPMQLPTLRRLTLALLNGDNPKLTLEVYVAVTSNTVQLGARLELLAAAWKFNAYGFLSFDVLIQFNPFGFVAEVTAMLALRVGSSSIASIRLTLTLEGPTPWKAKGDARLKLCWFLTVKIRFSTTFGEARTTTLPDVAVLPLVTAALTARDNWAEERPADQHRLESVRALASGAADPVRVHPVGTLAISQKVVPLRIAIDRLGVQRPSDARTFTIDAVTLNGTAQGPPVDAEESFAPAQYFDLSDEDKLAGPSFTRLASGLRVGDGARMRAGYAAAREVKYELKVIDSQRQQAQRPGRGGLFDVDATAFNAWTLRGAIAGSELSFARRRKSSLAPADVAIRQERFAVVHASDLRLVDDASVAATERAALQRRAELIASNPALRGALHVVPMFEMSV